MPLAEAQGVELHWLSEREASARFPSFRVTPGAEAVFLPRGGMLDADACVAAFQAGARARGAELLAATPVVGLEPSCLLTLKDEYVDLLRTDAARKVADQAALLEQFLLRERARGLTLNFKPGAREALLHGHCHQKAMVGTAPTVAVLKWAGYAVSEIDSGCCGMAGSFGFEREHYDVSVSLGNRRLAPAVKAAPAATEVVAPGISCRQQIQHLAGRRAKHPAEALLEALAR